MEGISIFFQTLVNGISLGSIYALVALGFVLIYKSTKVINFAHGDLMMIGAYLTFFFTTVMGVNFFVAIILCLVISAAIGVLVERLVLRRLIGEPIFSLVMVTIGLSTIIQGFVGLLWGHDVQSLPFPAPPEPITIGGIVLSQEHAWSIVSSVVLLVLFTLFFKKSKLGIAMRATSNDQDTASLMGISVKRIFALSWAIAAMVAAMSGVLFGSLNFFDPRMGFVGLRAFPAAILGGLDSVEGAILGGVVIGLIENMVGVYFDQFLGGGVKEIVSYIVLLLILVIKPYGLFGTEEIERV